MRYEIQHRTRYNYEKPVSQSLNLAHMMPRDTERQRCLRTDLTVKPGSASASEHTDYFGNRSYEFSIERQHASMEVVAKSVVELQEIEASLDFDFSEPCGVIRRVLAQSTSPEDLLAREYRLNSPLVMVDEDLAGRLGDYAGYLFADHVPFLTAVRQLTQRIYEDFEYDPDFSEVTTPLQEVFEGRKGVCQDFAHMAIACLRAQGYAARYVSGYLETQPPPGSEKLLGADASHAWFAVYTPDGWFEFDPTNDIPAGQQHIVTAWGRDYSDVPPLRGVIFGGGSSHELEVEVDVKRVSV